jgi:hypothetical protein
MTLEGTIATMPLNLIKITVKQNEQDPDIDSNCALP